MDHYGNQAAMRHISDIHYRLPMLVDRRAPAGAVGVLGHGCLQGEGLEGEGE